MAASKSVSSKSASAWSPGYKLPAWLLVFSVILNLTAGCFLPLILFWGFTASDCSWELSIKNSRIFASLLLGEKAEMLEPLFQSLPSFPIVDLRSRGFTTPQIWLWDLTLFWIFGFFHTLLAQRTVQSVMKKVIPPQLIRTVYMSVAGVLGLYLIAMWQPTGVELYNLANVSFLKPYISETTSEIINHAIFWPSMAYCGYLLCEFGGPSEFQGLSQLLKKAGDIDRTEGMPSFQCHGVRCCMRHPVYFFTLFAWVVASRLVLDRVILALSAFIYLQIAIPIEERKLIRLFGKDYETYKKNVYAMAPTCGACVSRCPAAAAHGAGKKLH